MLGCVVGCSFVRGSVWCMLVGWPIGWQVRSFVVFGWSVRSVVCMCVLLFVCSVVRLFVFVYLSMNSLFVRLFVCLSGCLRLGDCVRPFVWLLVSLFVRAFG